MLSEELDNGFMSGRAKSRDPGFLGYPETGGFMIRLLDNS